MKKLDTKLKLLIRRILTISLASFAIICLVFTWNAVQNLQQSEKLSKRKLSDIKEKIVEVYRKEDMLAKNFDLWKTLPKSKKLNNNNAYVTNADSIIKELCSYYHISVQEMSISSPEKSNPIPYYNVEMVKSDIKVLITAPSDYHIYLFLNMLSSEFPGYVIVRYFDIERILRDKNQLETKSKVGSLDNVVCRLIFDWYSLADNEK